MGNVIYSAIASADGYVEDSEGAFDWAEPTDEVLSAINDLERPVGTYLYGRRMYETMRYWETGHALPHQPPLSLEFARIWQAADKVVFSRTLNAVSTARTSLERDFGADVVRRLKSGTDRDLTVNGADLAGQALALGLVDELQLFLVPVTVGGGKPALPVRLRLDLELLETRAFADGTVFLRYRPKLA
jgi:dihydrofolate reductase